VVEILNRAGERPKSRHCCGYLRSEAPTSTERSPQVDEQTSQPNEDTYSTRVDEPEPVEKLQSDDEWLDDDAGED
jgi:hypothetical protein